MVDPATDTVLLERRDLQAFELPLDNQDTRAWQRIQVEIDELDAAGEPVKPGRAAAWRCSP